MNESAEIVALVEGKTEGIFISKLLAPHLARLDVYMTPIIISKPGEKGGDVRVALHVRLVGEVEIAAIGLGFAREGGLQVGLGLGSFE